MGVALKRPKKKEKRRKGILTQNTALMNLETTILSKISQAQKGKYCVIPLLFSI